MLESREAFNELMKDVEFAEWYRTRPYTVQQLIKKYPWNKYRMKEDAPYAITCPGSTVYLLSYRENGEVMVALRAADFLPATIAHIRDLCDRYKRDFDLMVQRDHSVHINPKYLEPIE